MAFPPNLKLFEDPRLRLKPELARELPQIATSLPQPLPAIKPGTVGPTSLPRLPDIVNAQAISREAGKIQSPVAQEAARQYEDLLPASVRASKAGYDAAAEMAGKFAPLATKAEQRLTELEDVARNMPAPPTLATIIASKSRQYPNEDVGKMKTRIKWMTEALDEYARNPNVQKGQVLAESTRALTDMSKDFGDTYKTLTEGAATAGGMAQAALPQILNDWHKSTELAFDVAKINAAYAEKKAQKGGGSIGPIQKAFKEMIEVREQALMLRIQAERAGDTDKAAYWDEKLTDANEYIQTTQKKYPRLAETVGPRAIIPGEKETLTGELGMVPPTSEGSPEEGGIINRIGKLGGGVIKQALTPSLLKPPRPEEEGNLTDAEKADLDTLTEMMRSGRLSPKEYETRRSAITSRKRRVQELPKGLEDMGM